VPPRETFAERVIDFYRRLRPPRLGDIGVDCLFPYRDPDVRACVETFYRKFFSDNRRRVFLIGINPGRFGAGTTAVPFTDPVTLERQCAIPNQFVKRRELSAEFIEQVVHRFGGPATFYRHFFITAASPVGFTRDGLNYNYYDDRTLQDALRPYMIRKMREQLQFGARRDVAVVLGTGKNYAVLSKLNAEQKFFDRLLVVDHPRFIMQYRRKRVGEYLDTYEATLRSCLD
jgi:hypothetical protein